MVQTTNYTGIKNIYFNKILLEIIKIGNLYSNHKKIFFLWLEYRDELLDIKKHFIKINIFYSCVVSSLDHKILVIVLQYCSIFLELF